MLPASRWWSSTFTSFCGWCYFSHDPQRYVFVVDQEVGVAEGAGSANHKIMAAMGRQFPEFAGVTDTEKFFASAQHFWVKPGAAAMVSHATRA